MCKLTNRKSNDFKVLSFNVEGLNSELDNPNFVDLLYKHDICLLNETWKGVDTKINLPGLWDFSLIRPKKKKFGRCSGGITIFCKEDIRSGIKVVQSEEGFVWLKLDDKIFGLKNPLFICATYIPPEYSTRKSGVNIDYYKNLTNSLANFSSKGNVLIAGDMNARLGAQLNKIHDLSCIDELVPDNTNYDIGERSSCDNITNIYGRKLDKICKSFNLSIANGRTLGDRLGNFTCYNNKGASVVDYVISDQSFFKNIKSYKCFPRSLDQHTHPSLAY